MTLCIRLFSELLLGKYQIPLPGPSESLLARRAHSLLAENRALLQRLKCNHRSATFSNILLPQAQSTIEAIGHAMAYSAGLHAHVPRDVLDVYECVVIRSDPSWFVETGGLSRFDQHIKEDTAVTSMMRNLRGHLDSLGLEQYVRASIISDTTWKSYLAELPVYSGHAITPHHLERQLQMQMQAKL